MGDAENKNWEWARLPAELRLRILHLLPLRAAVACRAVCKDWKDLLSTWSSGNRSWFLVKHELVEQEGSLRWAMIDAESGEWIQLQGLSRFATSVAAGDGLVCLCVGNSARPEFYVGNPLFQSSWQKLPELPPLKTAALARLVLSTSVQTCVLGIVCDIAVEQASNKKKISGCSFKLLIARCGYFFLYESSSGKWQEVQDETPALALQLLQETDDRAVVPVKRKNQLLWLPLRAGGGMVAFDFTTCCWIVLEATLVERLSAASLTQDPSTGRILLVGAHRSSGSHHYRHLKVWRLQEEEQDNNNNDGTGRLEWKSVNRMKDHMLQEISPKGFFTGAWCSSGATEALLLLTCTLVFSSRLRDWGFKRLVLWSYDPHSAKWSSDPLRRPLKDLDLSTSAVYPFRPRLDFE